MQNNKYVYFLSIKQAIELAEQHEDDEDWELWGDTEAIYLGEMKMKRANCELETES